ncbi:eukaryotic translation initiation factor 3 subunit G-domain-containing protein [Mycena haematopus]|nr:eukaryotic translation initiation factor 3 subunit G-domain-containing protein [Mycena haematopus]
MPVADAPIKTSWADELDEAERPKDEDFVDENGIRTTIQYTVNEAGKRVKITRRTRRVLQKSVVDRNIAKRCKWPKFGLEKGNPSGPGRTTRVEEEVELKISAGNKYGNQPEKEEESTKTKLAKAGAGKVSCRLCKGEHFTAKCPHKNAFTGLEVDAADEDAPTAEGDAAPTAGLGPGLGVGSRDKYVPPSMRPASGSGGSRDDLPTLRVTNISQDTEEDDLRELFGVFGRVARVYVGRDRETGVAKGFAYVSFEERAVAQKAMEKVNGKGYDNLILSVHWSQPRSDRR